MQEVTTIPGRTYAVECAGEVVITNNETGAIAAQGDGSGQVLFTACSNSYSVSDDTAKVVALFKVAPRLKLTLLQGVAGGYLPAGYTALEYLESSGTQYIDTGLQTTESTEIELKAQQTYFASSGYSWIFGAVTSPEYNLGISWISERNPDVIGFVGYAVIGNIGGLCKINAKNNDFRAQVFTASNKNGAFFINGQELLFTSSSSQNVLPGSTLTYLLFALSRATGQYTPNPGLRIFSFKDTTNGELRLRLIPALRNSDGVPGMWDTVSKQFFVNEGTGVFGYRIKRTGETSAPMSLRDPWRVAPSGVWAKLKAENELDIIADTELDDGEPLGYTWHSNTSEAYDAYGIVMQEDFN